MALLLYRPTSMESDEDLGNRALFRTGGITGGSRDDRSAGRGFPPPPVVVVVVARAVVAAAVAVAPPAPVYDKGEINVLLFGEDNDVC